MADGYFGTQSDSWGVTTTWTSPSGLRLTSQSFNEEALPGMGLARLFTTTAGMYHSPRAEGLISAEAARSLDLSYVFGVAFPESREEYDTKGSLQDILGQWILASAQNGIGREPIEMLREVRDWPVPAFGSPPHGWETLGTKMMGSSAAVVIAGVQASTGHPVMALLEVGAVTIVWFIKPMVKVTRRSLAERVADALGTTLRESDE